MSTGVITAITQDWRGSELEVDAAAIDTVLSVGDAGDFDEDTAATRWLVIGDETTPREYVSVDMDADTVTLAVAVGGSGLDEGEPVVVWDPTVGESGSRVVEYVASVQMSDDSGTAPAVIPHALIPASGVFGLVGASVSIVEDDNSEGDWYVDRVLGRENVLDGSYLDPDTITFPDPLVPTDPPTESPEILSVTGYVSGLIVYTEDADAVTTSIEFHISTTEGFTPDSSSLVVTTHSNVVNIDRLPDGSALAPGTVYYLKTVGVNVVDSATPSAEVSGQLDPSAVETVVAGKLVAGFILGSEIEAGRIEVGEMSIDSEAGIEIPSSAGTTRFPVNGTDPTTLAGVVQASTLTVAGNANLQGTTVVSGTGRLSSGVTNPTEPPAVSRTWDSVTTELVDDALIPPSLVRGISQNITTSGEWVVARLFLGASLRSVNKSTGAINPGVTTFIADFYPDGGITTIGSSYYLLGKDWNSGRNGAWYVYVLNSSFTKTDEFAVSVPTGITGTPAIGTDGTDVVIAYSNGSDDLRRSSYTTAGALLGHLTLEADVGEQNIAGVTVGSFDLGASRIVVSFHDKAVRAYDSTGARQSSHDFLRAGNASQRGLWWDGTRFYSVDNAGRFWEYADSHATASTIDAAWTAYDGNGTGGTHETEASPVAEFDWPARTRLVVEIPDPPESGDTDPSHTDKADRGRVYVASTVGGTLRLQSSLAVGERIADLEGIDTGSAAAPGSNGFLGVAGALGALQSTADDGSDPLTYFDGEGTARAALLIQSGADDVSVSASVSGFADVAFPVEFATTPHVVATTGNDFYNAAVTSISTTGVRLHVRQINNASATATISVQWIATTAT